MDPTQQQPEEIGGKDDSLNSIVQSFSEVLNISMSDYNSESLSESELDDIRQSFSTLNLSDSSSDSSQSGNQSKGAPSSHTSHNNNYPFNSKMLRATVEVLVELLETDGVMTKKYFRARQHRRQFERDIIITSELIHLMLDEVSGLVRRKTMAALTAEDTADGAGNGSEDELYRHHHQTWKDIGPRLWEVFKPEAEVRPLLVGVFNIAGM